MLAIAVMNPPLLAILALNKRNELKVLKHKMLLLSNTTKNRPFERFRIFKDILYGCDLDLGEWLSVTDILVVTGLVLILDH